MKFDSIKPTHCTFASVSNTIKKFCCGIRQLRIQNAPKDEALIKSMSPIDHVKNIKAPVFFIYDCRDVRVVMEYKNLLKDCLEASYKPDEWLVKNNEGHGFRKE